jgi:hypothetical protein
LDIESSFVLMLVVLVDRVIVCCTFVHRRLRYIGQVGDLRAGGGRSAERRPR